MGCELFRRPTPAPAEITKLTDDWPTYQHDQARSGITVEALQPPLWQQWTFVPSHPPAPAWGDPQPKPVEGQLELPRVRFDDAFHVAVVGDAVYFGSSADNCVYSLEASSGLIRWSVTMGGPVRLAPTVWQGKLYVGADDGYAYCLDASDGSLLWKFRGAPTDERVLGHGKLISLWPIRTGVLVDSGIAYFGAGIFPGEGLYLYAVGAEDGKLLWRNDNYDRGQTRGISPQGYLLASADNLFMPAGRAAPAAFARESGRFLYQRSSNWRLYGLFGGSYALLAGEHLYGGTEQILTYEQEEGSFGFAWFYGQRLIVTSDTYYMLTNGEIAALERSTYPAASRKRQALKEEHRKLSSERRLLTEEAWLLIRQIKKTEARVQRLDQELERLRKEPQTQSPKLAKLTRQRDELKEKVRTDTESKDALTPRIKERKEQLEAVEKEQGKAAEAVQSTVKWRCPSECPDSLILAGDVLYAGGQDRVLAVDVDTGEMLWTGKVEGKARGLAISNGRLFVSTDKGNIHCFVEGWTASSARVSPSINPEPYPQDSLQDFYRKTAEAIVNETGIKRGYCLILGAGTGQLALELARRTDLMVYGIEEDPQELEAARRALVKAGLYGTRVSIEEGTLEHPPCPDYFANLIVCEDTFLSGKLPTPPGELLRMLKPHGGVAYVGQPPGVENRAKSLGQDRLRNWLKGLHESSIDVTVKEGSWAKITRGALDGAGSWTHQYAEPGNTACGDDLLVRGPLGVLWFGEPGPGRMPSRHASAAAPLSVNGRLFVQGENVIWAYDAYNGLLLWERNIHGAMRLRTNYGESSNLAASGDSLFVVVGEDCLRLDQATGETSAIYHLPPSQDDNQRKWGYVACVAGKLFGSVIPGNRERSGAASERRSHALFALDIDSGNLLWTYQGKDIWHMSIAIGAGCVFLADTVVTEEQRQETLKDKLARLKGLSGLEALDLEEKLHSAKVRSLVALDVQTGQVRWQKPIDLSDCIGVGPGGGELSLIYQDKVLLLCGAALNGHFWKQFFAGAFSRRSIIALSSVDGKELWSGKLGYRSRPLVVGDTIYAEPWAYDLHTGEPRMRTHPVTGEQVRWQMARPGHHCGSMAASPNCLFFRSDSTGYYDLISDYGTCHFGGQRPGCWINSIAANGLVLIPEASSGCVCPFPIHCSVVLHPRKTNRMWGMFSSPGNMTPVRHLAINFGAPGDRRDNKGRLWLSYPRPRTGRLVLAFTLDIDVLETGHYYRHSPEIVQVEGTDVPWLFASGCSGLVRCAVPLIGEGEAPGTYTVRLSFSEPLYDRPGKRIFDVKIQDKVVLQNFDICKEAGGRNKAVVTKFQGIKVNDNLRIELVPRVSDPSEAQAPLLNGLEVRRTGPLR